MKVRLIVSFRNQGMGDNLASVANAWFFAKQTGRELVIAWIPCRYLGRRRENGFSTFFQVPEVLEGVRIRIPPRIDRFSQLLIAYSDLFRAPGAFDLRFYFAAGGWLVSRVLRLRAAQQKFLAIVDERIRHRRAQLAGNILAGRDVDERVLLVNGCIVPRPELRPFYDALRLGRLQPRVDAFVRQHFAGKHVVGVHVRFRTGHMQGSSHHDAYWDKPEDALRHCERQVRAAVAEFETGETVVFLSTDSARACEYFRNHFDHLVTVEKRFAQDETGELHDRLPVETADATLVEMFLLAHCDVLVRYPPSSYFSFYASLYVREYETEP